MFLESGNITNGYSDGNGHIDDLSTISLWKIYNYGFSTWVGVMMTSCTLGTVLNLLLLLVILLNRELRTGSGFLIAHSIFIELTLCAVHYPLYIISSFRIPTYGPLSADFCRYTGFFYYMALQSTFWASLALGINRFVAVIFPHCYQNITSRNAIVATVLVTYFMPLVCDLTVLVGWGGSYGAVPPWGSCGVMENKGVPQFVRPLLVALASQIPITALGVIYVVILAKLAVKKVIRRLSVTIVAADPTLQRHNTLHRRRIRIGKMLFVSYLWYLCCFIPPSLIGGFYLHLYAQNPLLQFWTRGLQVIGYSTNPIIFFVINKDYRKGLKSLLSRIVSIKTNNHLRPPKGIYSNRLQNSAVL